jgi:hypothetical protein
MLLQMFHLLHLLVHESSQYPQMLQRMQPQCSKNYPCCSFFLLAELLHAELLHPIRCRYCNSPI